MSDAEIRYRVTAALIQAAAPVPFAHLVEAADAQADEVQLVLELLESELKVVSGVLSDSPQRLYCWATVREAELRRGAADARRGATEAVADRAAEAADPRIAAASRAIAAGLDGPDAPQVQTDTLPNLHGEAAVRFCRYVVEEYRPPQTSAFLVVLQGSVRRPFSASPSHASMRRAIATATGFDPAADFERCPVHAVVLASYVGPVPYELEGVYPANVRAGGVKQMSPAAYDAARPVLVKRLADYLSTHGPAYRGAAAFAEGRYGEIVSEAAALAGREVVLLPRPDGAVLKRLGKSTPRKYWEKYWIQLYLQLREWLPAAQQKAADQRLQELGAGWDPTP